VQSILHKNLFRRDKNLIHTTAFHVSHLLKILNMCDYDNYKF